jgi:8-oxo-dGTP diphosphatase
MPSSRQRQLPILGASACVVRRHEVLLIQRGKEPGLGRWSLPGGHVEWGETTEAAATRELREETGLIVELTHFTGLHDIIRRDEDGVVQTHYVIAAYAAEYSGGEPMAGSDAMACQWVAVDNLQDFELNESIHIAIAAALKLLRP